MRAGRSVINYFYRGAAMKTLLTIPLIRWTIRHPVSDVTLFARETPSRDLVVAGIVFGRKKTFGKVSAKKSSDPRLRLWAGIVKDYLSGGGSSLAVLPLDLSRCTPFARAVLLACRGIPAGETASYAQLAEMAGRPAAVRAAASVMRNNPFPLAVPCHRVIAKSGGLGGFMGKNEGRPLVLKRRLLQNEGWLPNRR